ncbi:MAG: hypothetical protein K6C97_05835 [Treponema sp.]|nr:hypothetical protein [Treponema sp.]
MSKVGKELKPASIKKARFKSLRKPLNLASSYCISIFSFYITLPVFHQHTKLIEQFHNYLIVGGLPECVASWAEDQNSGTVLQIQKELLSLYENDIAKHNKKIDAGRILLVFKSLVTQLSKETLRSVDWLPADLLILDRIEEIL